MHVGTVQCLIFTDFPRLITLHLAIDLARNVRRITSFSQPKLADFSESDINPNILIIGTITVSSVENHRFIERSCG